VPSGSFALPAIDLKSRRMKYSSSHEFKRTLVEGLISRLKCEVDERFLPVGDCHKERHVYDFSDIAHRAFRRACFGVIYPFVLDDCGFKAVSFSEWGRLYSMHLSIYFNLEPILMIFWKLAF